MAKKGMIEPFVENQLNKAVISYGLSSYGYDLRIADEFRIFTNINTTIVDPKNFDPQSFVNFKGDVCIIPPNSFALARSVEYFRIPRNIITICLGKSTYARCGIITNVTPFEPCYSADTEILTPHGWQTFDNLLIGSLVMTMNPNTNIAEWQPIERKQTYVYEGELIHFNGRNIDLLVTLEHEVLVSSRNPRRNLWSDYKKIQAKNVYGKYNYRMTRYMHWRGEDIDDTIKIGKHTFSTNTFLNFLGTYLGDGSVYISNGGYVIKIAAMTEHDINRVQALINELGVKPNYDGRSWCFFSKDLYNLLKPLGHAHEKYIPYAYKNLPPNRLQHLLRGLMESDGAASTQTYTTISKQLADDVQEIIFKVGTAAIVRKVKAQQKGLKEGGFKGNYPVYKVRQATTQFMPKINPAIHKRVPYNGVVYDVTVPNHIIFVRRNGKPVWSGNCWEGFVTLEISNTTPLPAKIYANEGIAQVLFLSSDEVCEVSYADKKGRYQAQMEITLPKVIRNGDCKLQIEDCKL